MFDVERDGKPLRSAAVTVAESFPADWRSATFKIELERTVDGPRVEITFYEIVGEDTEQAGGICGGVC
jgi:hypothetical protein